MSLNELIAPSTKPWLNANVNDIKIYNNWTYKTADQLPGKVLVLDSNKVAQWGTASSSSPYGNSISVRPITQIFNSDPSSPQLYTFSTYSPLFSITNGNTYLTINTPGLYIGFVNVAYNDNISNSFEVAVQKDIGGVWTTVSQIRSFPGCVQFPGVEPDIQRVNICATALLNITAPTDVRLLFTSNPSSNVVLANYSSFTIVNVQS